MDKCKVDCQLELQATYLQNLKACRWLAFHLTERLLYRGQRGLLPGAPAAPLGTVDALVPWVVALWGL